MRRRDYTTLAKNLHIISNLAERMGHIIGQLKAFARKSPARPQPEMVQRSGTKTSPKDAGAADPARPRRREIAISTTTVARYGKDDMNWEGIGT